MSKLFILGAGGHGDVIANVAAELGWLDILFFDDSWPQKKICGNRNIIGDFNDFFCLPPNSNVFISVGNNFLRHNLALESIKKGYNLISLIHPRAYVSKNSLIGVGSCILPGAVIETGSNLGMSVIVNTNASVNHGCILQSAVHISPGAHIAGDVIIGLRTWVGIGASIKEGIQIGDDCIIGAGAAVINNLPNKVRVGGVPAKFI